MFASHIEDLRPGVGSKDAESMPSVVHMNETTSRASMENRKNGFFFVGIRPNLVTNNEIVVF
jgi:hypothetical protein